MNWDVFISHASEDKKYARDLANSLVAMGVKVWFDEFELKIGDSLTRSIDLGLSKSTYGIVILSPSFFAKEWTQKELGGLTSRETGGEKVLLPIWHNINHQEVSKYSPMLADRFAIFSDENISKISETLYSLIKGKPKEKERSYLEIDLAFTKKLAHNKQIELEGVIAQAREVSQIDDLTMLFNRRAILNELQNEIIHSNKNNSPLSILIIDIDNFKTINDSHGHLVGDNFLRMIGQNFKSIIKHPNIIGRYGGEEFLVVMPNSRIDSATKQAEVICQLMRNKNINFDDLQFTILVSIGIAEYKPQLEDWHELINRADKALYKAKDNGGNQWQS